MRYFVVFIFALFALVPEMQAANNDFTSESFMLEVAPLSPLQLGADPGNTSSRGSLMLILGLISQVLLYLIPILAAISGIIAGYYYIFSGGDTENTSRAKTIIKYNIMALFLAFASYSIIRLVIWFVE